MENLTITSFSDFSLMSKSFHVFCNFRQVLISPFSTYKQFRLNLNSSRQSLDLKIQFEPIQCTQSSICSQTRRAKGVKITQRRIFSCILYVYRQKLNECHLNLNYCWTDFVFFLLILHQSDIKMFFFVLFDFSQNNIYVFHSPNDLLGVMGSRDQFYTIFS